MLEAIDNTYAHVLSMLRPTEIDCDHYLFRVPDRVLKNVFNTDMCIVKS